MVRANQTEFFGTVGWRPEGVLQFFRSICTKLPCPFCCPLPPSRALINQWDCKFETTGKKAFLIYLEREVSEICNRKFLEIESSPNLGWSGIFFCLWFKFEMFESQPWTVLFIYFFFSLMLHLFRSFAFISSVNHYQPNDDTQYRIVSFLVSLGLPLILLHQTFSWRIFTLRILTTNSKVRATLYGISKQYPRKVLLFTFKDFTVRQIVEFQHLFISL